MGIQLLLHKTIKHFLREQRLLVAKGLADEDQGHYGLTTGVQPEGIQGVQRLLGGLVQGEMQQKAAVLFPAALVHELVGVPVLVQTVEALVQRQVGAELRKAGGAVLLRRVFSRRDKRKTITPSTAASRTMETAAFMKILLKSFSYCNTTRILLCYNIFNSLKILSGACALLQAGGTQ